MTDSWIGELFADKDPRSEGRIVKVLEQKNLRGPDGTVDTHYVVEIVAHPIATSVGRKSTVSWRTLETRYKKVSH